MKEYELLWSDGNGALSRGTESDNICYTRIKCQNVEELWTIAYLLRAYYDILPWANEEISSLEELTQLLEEAAEDDWDSLTPVELDELPKILETKYDSDSLDDINFDDIDGGAPWIINIYDCDTNEQLYTDDYYDNNLDDFLIDDEEETMEEMYENFKNSDQKVFKQFKKIRDNNYC